VNYSTAIFLINPKCRAVMASYESAADGKTSTLFKTLDQDIAVGDYVLVPTVTRHGMAVCLVTQTDVDVDYDSTAEVKWIVNKIDRGPFDILLAQEGVAIGKIKSAEVRKKREAMAAALLADVGSDLKQLAITGSAEPEPIKRW